MSDVVECPYCLHDNDMSDGLTDLPKDNKFDHECGCCGKEFEVFVEFDPSYSADKIVYSICESCGEETRDVRSDNNSFPFPKSLKGKTVCTTCFFEGLKKDYQK